MKIRFNATVALFALVATAGLANAQGRIVVGHDANTLATNFAGPNEVLFATNVADWLTGGNVGDEESRGGFTLLLIEAGSTAQGRHDYSSLVEDGLSMAGYSVVVTDETNWTLEQLNSFDAIFVGANETTLAFPDANILQQYVNTRGGVFTFSGKGPNRTDEAASTNAFLSTFGLAFDDNEGSGNGGYNGIYGTAITGTHPIFDGVSFLGSANGQDIIDLGTNPNAQIVQTSVLGGGVYGVIDGVIPSPASAALLGLGGLVAARRRRA